MTPNDEVRRLPPLREDLELLPAARSLEGDPHWLIFDPLRNRYFQIDKRGFEMIRHWGCGTVQDVITQASTPLAPGDIEDMEQFLATAELLDARKRSSRAQLASRSKGRSKTWLQQLLHSYLFMRIPLLKPDALLDGLYPRVQWLFSRWFVSLSVLVGVVSMLLILQRFDEFITGFPWLLTPYGAFAFFWCLLVIKAFHELGHALACRHYGLRVPTMGVAFLVMWPVLYTDATHAWRLRKRRQRAFISAAGVITELILACWAMLLWLVLPDGIIRSLAFAVAATTWALSLMVNLNPLMRFDGYYFLSDWLNVPNLQSTAFSLTKARLRSLLFGTDMPAREFSPRLENFLVLYGMAVWVYRFFLFLGIALLVYQFFFKALGIALFVVEIGWFIVRPVATELRAWWPLRHHLSFTRKAVWTGLLGAGLLLMIIPWQHAYLLPAELESRSAQRIYTPADGQITQLKISPGETVSEGAALIEVSSPKLAYQHAQAKSEYARLHDTLDRIESSERSVGARLVLRQQLEKARSELAATARQIERLAVTAPFEGVVSGMSELIHEGRWVAKDTYLLTLSAPHSGKGTAWADEASVERIKEGKAWFYSDAPTTEKIPVEIVQVESSAVQDLSTSYHASEAGGDLPVRPDADGKLIPEQALYRVHFSARDHNPSLKTRGWVRVYGEGESLAVRLYRWVAALLIREAGF